jgi:hypothetical protein
MFGKFRSFASLRMTAWGQANELSGPGAKRKGGFAVLFGYWKVEILR